MGMNKKPNIIVLLQDQQQALSIESGHFCMMPNIAKLQQESVVCSRTHTCNAVCSPSRASLMTGVLPHKHGMVDCTHTVPEYRARYNASLDTLSRALKDEDYMLSYYGKWHVERSNRLEQFGFDEYETEATIPRFTFTPLDTVAVKGPGYIDKTICGVFSEGMECTEEAYIYDKAMDFIGRKQASGQPWCTFISTYAPHDPYSVPKEIYNQYADIEIPLPESFFDPMMDKPGVYRRLKAVWKDLTEAEVKMIIRCYYSYCTLVDRQAGRLLAYLKEIGEYDNTLIVYLSDHGDLMGAHGLFCKGVPAFEEIYKIPLFFKFPYGLYGGSRMEQLAGTCDVAPTILDIAGCRCLTGETDGESLLPWLSGVCQEERIGFAEFQGQRYAYTQRIVWKGSFKYVFNTFDYDEFYDLEKDPWELVNQIDNEDYAASVRELAEQMWSVMKKTGDATMTDAQYYMLRFAPVGPGVVKQGEEFSIYNKPF